MSLKQRVMRRVYIMWTLRKIFSPGMVKVYLAVAFLWELGRQVFVAQVFSNSPSLSQIGENVHFFLSAFTSTDVGVQLVVVAFVVIVALLVRDVLKTFASRSMLFAGGR